MPEITKETIVRAWKDEKFHASLAPEVRAQIPAPPQGAAELSDEQLEAAAGGTMAMDGLDETVDEVVDESL